MIQPVFSTVITLLLAKFMINDLPHAAGLLGNPNTPDDSWDNVWKSCVQAAKILGKELTEQDIPANWPELRRLLKDLWAQVYAKRKLGSGNPGAAAKVLYHVTPKGNVESIMSEGLYTPVHLLTSGTKAREWRDYVGEYEPAVVLVVTLPEDWPTYDDPLHPAGMAVVSDRHIPAKHVVLAVMKGESQRKL